MPLFTADTPIEEMIVALHAKIGALPSAALAVTGRSFTMGDLAKAFITGLVTATHYQPAVDKATERRLDALRMNHVAAHLSDRDLVALGELFAIQDLICDDIIRYDTIIEACDITIMQDLVPNHGKVRFLIPNSGGIQTRNVFYIGGDHKDTLDDSAFVAESFNREVRKLLNENEHAEIDETLGNFILTYFTPTHAHDITLGYDVGRIGDHEARHLAQLVRKLIDMENPRHLMSDMTGVQRLFGWLRRHLEDKLASNSQIFVPLHHNYVGLWFRFDRKLADGSIEKGAMQKIKGSDKVKLREKILALAVVANPETVFQVHPLFEAYIAANFPGRRDSIIQQAKDNPTQAWNIRESGDPQKEVWTKVVGNEIRARFTLAPGIAWAYDRLVLNKRIVAGIPQSARLAIKPGNRLDQYVDLTAIPGLENAHIADLGTAKGDMWMKLELRPA